MKWLLLGLLIVVGFVAAMVHLSSMIIDFAFALLAATTWFAFFRK